MSYYKKSIVLLCFICSFALAKAQDKEMDSLKSLLIKTSQDSSRIELLLSLGDAYYYKDLDSAILFYIEAKEISSRHGSNKIEAESDDIKKKYLNYQAIALKSIGFAYKDLGDYDKALDYHSRSLEVYSELGNKKGIAGCLSNIGIVYQYEGLYDKAIIQYLKALKVFEEGGIKKGISACYTNIGIVFYKQSNYDKAIEYYGKSLQIEKELGDKNAIAGCYMNIGIICGEKNDFQKSIDCFNESKKLFEEIGDIYGVSQCYNNIGNLYQMDSKYDKAIEFYKRSLELKEKINDKHGIIICYNGISSLNLLLADSLNNSKAQRLYYLRNSLEYGIKAIDEALGINAVPLANEAAINLMTVYEKLGDFKNALKYGKIYISTRDSLFKEEKTKSIADAETKFKAEKKQLEIDKLNKEKEFQESEILRQRLIILFVIIGLALIAAFAVFAVNRWRITRRQREEIRAQRDQIDEQHKIVSGQKDRIEKQKQQITNSINYARRIQKAVLLSGEHASDLLGDHFILYKPKDIVSGDFYWATSINEFLILTVADCTGHGVPGAFMSMLGVSFLNEIVRKKEVTTASDVLNQLRESIIDALQQKSLESEQKDGLDIVFCVLNKQTKVLQYAGAFNPLYIVTAQKELKVIQPDKQPVAIYENMKEFTNKEIQLYDGDKLYLLTDGFEDQFGGEDDKKFMTKHLKELLIEISQKTMSEQYDILAYSYEKWKGQREQTDDVTIVGMKI